MKTHAFGSRVLLAVLFTALLVSVRPVAADQADVRRIADRIVGGASLMRELGRDREVDTFYDRARRFADLARGATGPGDLDDEWRRLRSSYRAARKASRRSRDEGWRFLTAHLDEDFADGSRILGSSGDDDGGAGELRRLSLIRDVMCFGRNNTDHACPNRRDSLTFALPRDVAVIRRFDVEWRDYGENANGEVYLNDRLVWRQDVKKDWGAAGRELNVRVPAGSVLTIRSSNGDPIWVRKLTVDVLEREDRDDYRDPWNLPYDPWR